MRPISLVPPHLFVLPGAVNTGVLVHDRRALLLDCCDSVTPERLAALGVDTIDWICCTQHRRPNTAGVYRFLERGAQIAAPAAEEPWFARPGEYWANWRNRWHVPHAQPGPLVPIAPIRVSRAVIDGDTIEWEGFRVRVLATPGATDGSVSYLVELPERQVCFCGDVLCGPGQVWELYSLQKGYKTPWDYHGFMGNLRVLRPALEKLAACGAQVLVPSHGPILRPPRQACEATLANLDRLWRNYVYVSSMNHYFPEIMQAIAAGLPTMPSTEIRENPPFIRYANATSLAVVSETGAAFVIDAGSAVVIDTLHKWRQEKSITDVEGVWVSHYHDDHTDALGLLHQAFGCPVYTDEHMSEILTHPRRYCLPFVSPNVVPAVRPTRHGETMTWHEFTFTFYHFPGQTEYHSGLLVEGRGQRIFFCGDSFSPCGLDDYCPANRNFLGAGRGLGFCLDLLRELDPDLIYNQHQRLPFHFAPTDIDVMQRTLAERVALLREILPWPDPNFGLDEHWVRVYPYEQDAGAGSTAAIDVCFTNHAATPAKARVRLVLPPDLCGDRRPPTASITVPRQSDGAARLLLHIPRGAAPGLRVLPVQVWWDGRYLGQFRHAFVYVF